MKYIKPYQIFESSASALTAEQIEWLDECAAGRWKLNTSTGLVDINGIFNCTEQGLIDFKGVRFGKVSGDFDCNNNQLTSLMGAPQTVGAGFFCDNNQLTTLKGAPQSVGENFYCGDNQLTSLEGAPQSINGTFDCDNNHLTTLVGAPQSVGRSFDCGNNQLTSLEGAPQTVGVDFYCQHNLLTTLVGAPQSVGRDFYCQHNLLTTLVGAPQSVGRSFDCGGNPVPASTIEAIIGLMKRGNSYQKALEEYWPDMEDDDRVLMYKDHPSLSPEETRKYKALATYANIKDYL
jgi:hypothetical protein